jgi:para-nitrobenzyl esterase
MRLKHPNRRELLRGSCVAIGAALLRPALASDSPVVETSHGKLGGVSKNGVRSFRGIPYGASTAGDNRFAPPAPPPAWTGIRDAVNFGPRSPQPTAGQAAIFSPWYGSDGPQSENCLVLNVYTAATSGDRLPVMLYIHGGGYATGSSASPVLGGSNLAKQGHVVVVTINHRLSLFAHTYFGEMDGGRFADAGNAGLLDVIAALKWVKENIAQFGGDPGNVTLFGQSGGGSKISVLMAMPQAQGLFHRAINMSGVTGFRAMKPEDGQRCAELFLKALDVEKNNLSKIEEFTPEQLLAARSRVMADMKGDYFRPVVDNRSLHGDPLDASPQISADVPLLIGNADTEITFYLANDRRNFSCTAQQTNIRVREQLKIDENAAQQLISAYQKNDPTRNSTDTLIAIGTDYVFRVPMIRAAELIASKSRSSVYMYNFAWRSPVDGGIYRSPHTIDIPFAFGNVDIADAITNSEASSHAASNNLLRAFSNFARTGNPNGGGSEIWPPLSSKTVAMVFDAEMRVDADYKRADRSALEKYPSYRHYVDPLSIYAYHP